MTYKPYLELVRKHFSFLNDHFNFASPLQLSSDNDPQGYGRYALIKYLSAWAFVIIERERDNVLSVRMGPLSEENGLAIEWIVEFLTDRNKTIDFKPYIELKRTAWTIRQYSDVSQAYREGRDVRQYGNKAVVTAIVKELDREQAWEEYRLATYASAIQHYCEPFLSGDFSKWPNLCKYVDQKIEDRIRSWTHNGAKHN